MNKPTEADMQVDVATYLRMRELIESPEWVELRNGQLLEYAPRKTCDAFARRTMWAEAEVERLNCIVRKLEVPPFRLGNRQGGDPHAG